MIYVKYPHCETQLLNLQLKMIVFATGYNNQSDNTSYIGPQKKSGSLAWYFKFME